MFDARERQILIAQLEALSATADAALLLLTADGCSHPEEARQSLAAMGDDETVGKWICGKCGKCGAEGQSALGSLTQPET